MKNVEGLEIRHYRQAVTFKKALSLTRQLNRRLPSGRHWRLPEKQELQVLAAKPSGEKTSFHGVVYWSHSTTHFENRYQADGVAIATGVSRIFGVGSQTLSLVLVR